MSSVMIKLSKEQIRAFDEQGFLRLERITSDEDVERLRASYDRIFADRAGRDEGFQFDLAGTDEDDAQARLPQILLPAKYAPEMNESELLANATRVARQLLGDDATCNFAHAILKPPRDGAETPWHQDAAYWNPNTRYRTISIWVPLQEATLENGCMQFVPGSHRLDVLPHRSIGGDPRVHGLELERSAKDSVRRPVPCPIPAGGCTIHDGYTLHYAGPNRSDIPRRALILSTEITGSPLAEPRQFPWQLAWDTVARKKRTNAGS
jgi:hypothetical protein